MGDNPEETETEVEETETEETDDGASNWDRMERLIDGAVKKNLGELNIEATLEKVVKKWRTPAPKNSQGSQQKQEKTDPGETPDRSKSSRRKGLLSDGFFKGL